MIDINCTIINQSAFAFSTNIERVTLHSVQRIESFAFFSCYSLSKIIIPDSLQSVGPSSFSRCNIKCDSIQYEPDFNILIFQESGVKLKYLKPRYQCMLSNFKHPKSRISDFLTSYLTLFNPET